MFRFLLLSLTLLAIPAAAAAAVSSRHSTADQALLVELVRDVDAARLRATIKSLVGFGTRHTLSDTTSNTRGIGAARRWTAARFHDIGQACGGCLEIATPSQTVTGKRIPRLTSIVDVVAVQRGTRDPDRVVLVTGHIDSRVTDIMNAASDAPGADDDGSGVAAVLEAARVLSRHRFAATLVYGVLSGEEQGLYGGKVLADYAHAHGWRIEADLNNDIVGGSHGQSGVHDPAHVRVFSEGTKATETPEQAASRRYNGGEVDSPSRSLSRFIADLAPRYLDGFQVRMVYRTDRFSRGGDQVPFLDAGFPAVRLTEASENYDRQHQDVRTEHGRRYGDVIEGVDFAYLAQVVRLNIVALAALASAPAPPTEVKLAGAVTADTTLSWSPSSGAASYRVWWRDTTAPQWDRSRSAGPGNHLTLVGVNIDDFFFGVSAISTDGFASPVEFPGPPGAFLTPAAKP